MKYYLILIVVAALLIAVLSMIKIDKEYEYTEIDDSKVETIENDWCDLHECKG